jgi:raffinose/stachyose/melibiose transport system substrate-binding protein
VTAFAASRRSRGLLWIVVVVGLLVVAGCGGGDDKGSSDAKKVTLRYLTEPGESARQEQAAAALVNDFNKSHPDIQVKRETITFDQEQTVIQARLKSNDAPDVFTYGPGKGFAGVLADAGLLYPLTEGYRKYGWKIYDWTKPGVTFNGTIYGIPDQIEALGIFYNKDLFAKWGIGTPDTTANFRAAVARAKQEGLVPIAFGDKEGWEGGHVFSMGLSSAIDRSELSQLIAGKASWSDPGPTAAIRSMFVDLLKQGAYTKQPTGVTYDSANALYFAKKAAMVATGTWLAPDIAEKTKFESGFAAFPSLTGGPANLATGVGGAWYVAKRTKHPQEALVFLDWLLQKKNAERALVQMGNFPAQPIPVDVNQLQVPELSKQVTALIAKLAPTGNVGYNLDVVMPPKFNQTMFSGFQSVMTGRRSPEQQAAALQSASGGAG